MPYYHISFIQTPKMLIMVNKLSSNRQIGKGKKIKVPSTVDNCIAFWSRNLSIHIPDIYIYLRQPMKCPLGSLLYIWSRYQAIAREWDKKFQPNKNICGHTFALNVFICYAIIVDKHEQNNSCSLIYKPTSREWVPYSRHLGETILGTPLFSTIRIRTVPFENSTIAVNVFYISLVGEYGSDVTYCFSYPSIITFSWTF